MDDTTVNNAVHRELGVILDAMSQESRCLLGAQPVYGGHFVVMRLYVSSPAETIFVVGFEDEDRIVRVTSNYWGSR